MISTPMPIPDGSAVITPNQQYAELQALRRSVDALVSTVDPALSDLRADVLDHETRLRSVERKVWMAAGFAAAVGGVGGGLLSKLLGG